MTHTTTWRPSLFLGLLLSFTFASGCEKGADVPLHSVPRLQGDSNEDHAAHQTPSTAAQPAGRATSAANVQWQAPETWVEVPPSNNMRAAEWRLDDASGGPSASCYVAVAGGSVEQNIQRWIGQFDSAGEEPLVASTHAGGMNITMVQLVGTFNAGDAPIADFGLLGAVVETSPQLTFLKCIGPAPTLAQHMENFQTFITSFSSGS